MKFPPSLLVVVFFLISAAGSFSPLHAEPSSASRRADVVLVNGRIWTGVPTFLPGEKISPAHIVQAAAILNGRFIAVGSDAEIRSFVTDGTQVIDLRGKLALPGFNDAHVHFMQGSGEITQINLRQAKSEAELTALVEAKAKTMKPGQWILGGSWDETNWPGSKLPNHALVDAVSKDNPLFVVRYDGHESLVNAQVLRLVGITKETKDPVGGMIVRDPKRASRPGF